MEAISELPWKQLRLIIESELSESDVCLGQPPPYPANVAVMPSLLSTQSLFVNPAIMNQYRWFSVIDPPQLFAYVQHWAEQS